MRTLTLTLMLALVLALLGAVAGAALAPTAPDGAIVLGLTGAAVLGMVGVVLGLALGDAWELHVTTRVPAKGSTASAARSAAREARERSQRLAVQARLTLDAEESARLWELALRAKREAMDRADARLVAGMRWEQGRAMTRSSARR